MEMPEVFTAKLFSEASQQARTADGTRDARTIWYKLYTNDAGQWIGGNSLSVVPNSPVVKTVRRILPAYAGISIRVKCLAPLDDGGVCGADIHLSAYAANRSDAVAPVLQHLRREHGVECHRDKGESEAPSPSTPSTPSKSASPKKRKTPTCLRFFRNGRADGAVRVASASLSLDRSYSPLLCAVR